MTIAENILMKKELSREDLIYLLLSTDETEKQRLFTQARMATIMHCGNKINLRGLIELSNQCKKDCLYCGIRAGNTYVNRYILDPSKVLEAAEYAWKKGYGSIVIQGGERQDKAYANMITDLLVKIRELSNNELGITLSCGEQEDEVYKEWLDAGAHRYLLRIETSNENLYSKIHPDNETHDFHRRIHALKTLQSLGYQTGTGVMVGLPGQSVEQLADDLLFMKEFGIDMAGMGPYIPHPDTPLFYSLEEIPDKDRRLDLSLKMIALLRLLMKDINIAASTALQTLDPNGRLKAIACGANVFMPNLTPAEQAGNYSIYSGKPLYSDMAETALIKLEEHAEDLGFVMNYNERGDSKHYFKRIRNN
jgi:biotin synthase